MIKKTKLFGLFLSANVLLPFSFLTACDKSKTDSVTGSDYSESSSNSSSDNKLTISEEIKSFIKNGVSPKEDQDESILVIKDLVSATDSRTKIMETDKVEKSLNDLASNLNKTSDANKVELTDNKVVKDALKQIIYENCKTTAKLLKSEFSSEFGEVASDKILEINENELFFNLMSFGIDKILHDIGYDSDNNDKKVEIANSQALKIYKFSTDLKIIVNTNGGKKVQVTISDLNLFVVSDKEQVVMLKKGIADYLQEKFKTETISLYLDGNEPRVNSDREINEHFIEILKNRNYNLVDNEKVRIQTMSYLVNKYLPKLIYKNPNQIAGTKKQEIPIKIDSQNLTFNSEKDNFLKDGVEINDLDQKINFLNFFGNQQHQRQITPETIGKIKPEHFLRHKDIHHGKYYSLGSGVLNVNQWNISGFSIRPIDINFDIFINCEILGKEIRNLQTCLNNLLNKMKSSLIYVTKENDRGQSSSNNDSSNQKYVFRVMPPKLTLSEQSSFWDKAIKGGVTFDELLNSLYMTEVRKMSSSNFSPEIFKKINFEFLVKFSNQEHKLLSDKRTLYGGTDESTLRELRNKGIDLSSENKATIEILFIFNNSFKIKLTDKLLVSKLDNGSVNQLA